VTCREMIDRVDRLRPNTLPFEDKLQWLEQLDLRAFEEVILTHIHEEGLTFSGHGEGESQLLIPPPYDEVYCYWLCMQMDLVGRELTQYNNDRALFASAWLAWSDWMNRTLLPLQEAKIQL